MKEGTDKIEISCGDILALTQEISNKDVKYARLEMRYEIEESARMKAEAEANCYKEENKQLREENAWLKSQLADKPQSPQQPDREQMEQTIALLLENHVVLSLPKMQEFIQNHMIDLATAMLLRGFVQECIPDDLKSSSIGLVSKLQLPERPKPQPTIDNRTINLTGKHATYEEHTTLKE